VPLPSRLCARTVEIADPGPLDALMGPGTSAAWIRHGDGMIGIGRAASFSTRSADSLAEAEGWWHELGQRIDGDGARAFGAFTFDPAHTTRPSVLIVPELIIGRTGGSGWLTAIGPDPAACPTLPGRLDPVAPAGQVTFGDGALTSLQWESAVAAAVDKIQTARSNGGGLDKVVLARDLIALADAPIDQRRLVAALTREYTRCWTYAIDGLVGATPEMLIRRERGLATSRVLAGTIRRTGDDDHDLALAAALSQSSKDLEEHEYAVASVAEALTPFCSGTNVPDAPYVLALPNVLHLATDVTAVADADATVLSMAGALHPSAAVCGTPTEQARRVIADLERMDRERYAGPVGWVDAHGDGEWGIALRCGQISDADPRQIRLFAGCGIVAGSDPVAELAESNAKLVPMRDAVAG